mmetsp:Transcript_14613/g.34760  ORF Transcript_14613/g.34760 Transcript_14613/m.34760 type:complete len:87 (-) Transcript_14613:815-1075(-)
MSAQAWVKMLAPTPACSALARLLDWVVEDALTTGPKLIMIKVYPTTITVQHDGAAPASVASLGSTLSLCSHVPCASGRRLQRARGA